MSKPRTESEIFCERRKYEMLDVLRHELNHLPDTSPTRPVSGDGGTSTTPASPPAGAAHNSELDFWLTGGLAL